MGRQSSIARRRVVASFGPEAELFLLWVLMITSAENRPWTGDLPIIYLGLAGLPAPSVIRTAKIATIDAVCAENCGSIDTATLARVMAAIRTLVA